MSKQKLDKAIEYLRKRNIYRADIHHNHRYEQHVPNHQEYAKVTVTVCCKGHYSVTHAMRSSK